MTSSELSSYHSKSMPPSEFPIICISSADSGIDSDTSPAASTKLTNSIEDIETDLNICPKSFILGKNAAEGDRIDGINKAIGWIKDELIKMKSKDKQLTKIMITLRSQIAEQKLKLEKFDKGYDSDSEATGKQDNEYVKERWKLIAQDGAFPTDGMCFENNKRATWAI